MTTPEQHESFLRQSFDAYLAARRRGDLEPVRRYILYDAIDLSLVSRPPISFALVEEELRELTNNLNAWMGMLRRWHAWMIVAAELSDDDLWDIEMDFIIPLATFCLFQPSSVRDTFTLVATNGMHQVRLLVDADYADCLPLDQDPWMPPKYPNRRKKEGQLEAVLKPWPEGQALLESLQRLDDGATRRATADFRNRASHSIAPRFSRGITQAVTRRVIKATEQVQQADGKFKNVPIQGQKAVGYGFGGLEALDLEEMRQINLAQFSAAASCFDNYINLLKISMNVSA